MAYQDDSFESFVKKQKPVDPPDDSFESFARRQEPQPKVKGQVGPTQRELHTGAPGQDSYNLAPPVKPPTRREQQAYQSNVGDANAAAKAIRDIEAKKAEAVRLFQQVDKTPADLAGTSYTPGRNLPIPLLGSDNKPILERDRLRARAEGALEAANELARRAQGNNRIEVGFSKDADPASSRQWAYAKPKNALTHIAKKQQDLKAKAIAPTDEQRLKGKGVARLLSEPSPEVRGLTTEEAARSKSSADIPEVGSFGQAKNAYGRGALEMLAGTPYGVAKFGETLADKLRYGGGTLQDQDGAVSGLLRRPTDEATANIRASLPTNPNDNSWMTSKIPQALGSMTGFAALGGIGGAVGAAPSAVAGIGGIGAEVSSFLEEAKQAGIDPARVQNGILMAGATGMTEMFGLGRMLDKFGVKRPVLEKALDFLEEGGQEALQGYMEDINAKLIAAHDPNRNINPNSVDFWLKRGEEAALGLIAAAPVAGADLAIERVKGQIENRKKGQLDAPAPASATPAPFGFRPTNKQPTTVVPLGAPRSPQATQTAATQADFSKRMAGLPESDQATLEFQTAIAQAQRIPDPVRRAQAIANIRAEAQAEELIGVDRGTPIQDRLAQTGINRPGPNLAGIRAENLDFVPPGRQPQIDALNKEIEREGQFKAKEEKLNRLNADLAFEGQKRAREIENQKLNETLRALQEADKANRQRAKEQPRTPAAPVAPPASPLMESITNPEGGVPFAPEIKASPGAMFDKMPFTETQEDIPDVLKAIRKYGGVRDDGIHGGEITSLLGNKETGTTGLINKNGLTPDRMRESLVQDGILSPESTVADFFDLVRDSQSRRTGQPQTATSFDDFYSSQPEAARFGAQRSPKGRTGVPIPGRKAITPVQAAPEAPAQQAPMSRYKQLQRAAETTFPDFWDAPVTADRRKALLEYGSEYDVDNLISEAQNYQVAQARRQDAIQKAGKSAFEKENAAAEAEDRLEIEVQKLDNFFNDLESDTDLADEFDKAIRGENSAEFARVLNQMYGISEETTNELIEARRSPEYGRFAKEHESTAEKDTARPERDTAVNAPAPAEPTLGEEERGKLDKLLAFNPANVTGKDIDRYIAKLEEWRNRQITKGDVPREASEQIRARLDQANEIRKGMVKRKEIGAKFPSRRLTDAETEARLQKEKDKKAAEVAQPSPAETPSRTVSEETKPIAGEKVEPSNAVEQNEYNPKFRMWRVQGQTARHARPGERISLEEATDVIESLRRHGLKGSYDSDKGVVRISTRSGLMSDMERDIRQAWNQYGSQSAQDIKQSQARQEVVEKRKAAEKQYQEDINARESAATWIDAVFGVGAMNDFNKSKLAAFLDGDVPRFEGLPNPNWKAGLEKIGAIKEGSVDFNAIKQAYQKQSKPTPKKPPISDAIRSALPEKSNIASVKDLRNQGYSDEEIIQAVKDSKDEFRLSRDNRSETAIKATDEKDTSGEPLLKMDGEYYVPFITVVSPSPEAAPAKAPETASVPGGELTRTEQKILDLLDPAKSPKGAAYGWLEARTGKDFAEAIKGLVDSGKVRQSGGQYYRADAPEVKTEAKRRESEEVKGLTKAQKEEYERGRMANLTHDEAMGIARKVEKKEKPKEETKVASKEKEAPDVELGATENQLPGKQRTGSVSKNDRAGTESGRRESEQGGERGTGEPDSAGRPDVGSKRTGDANSDESVSGGAVTAGQGGRGRQSDSSIDEHGGEDTSRTESQEPSAARRPSDYVITDIDAVTPSGKVAKLRANLAAIRLVKTILSEGRSATAEEQDILAQYTGWGQFSELFNEYNEAGDKLAAEREELKELVGQKEYEEARASTKNAHYTSPRMIAAMWRMAERLGIRQGRVLEPSMGIGSFFGLMPKHLRGVTARVGIELDILTGQMAKLLYPQSNVQIKGFEKHKVPDNFYDLVIGNVPFGDYRVHDPEYNKYRANIHDYFILKSIDKTRPGGLVAVITSTGTLDKSNDKIRKAIASKANLVAAMRLPESTFEKNAGTAVVTDLLIFQRRGDGIAEDKAWVDLGTLPDPDGGADIPISKYYVQNPQMILGTLDRKSRMYSGGDSHVSRTDDFEERLSRAIDSLPQGIVVDPTTATTKQAERVVNEDERLAEGSLTIKDGKVYRRSGDHLVEEKMDESDVKKLTRLLNIRNALQSVINDQIAGKSATESRAKLNQEYDYFVSVFGPLRKRGNASLLAEDPSSYLILALESDYNTKTGKAKKAPIFTRDIISRGRQTANATTASDAVAASLFTSGEIDMAYMAGLLKTTEEDLAKQLISQNLAFENPSTGWESSEKYLSGNVRKKLIDAKAAADLDPRFLRNVEALAEVQPADIDTEDISVRFGSPWVPPEDIQDFLGNLLDGKPDHFSVQYSANGGQWFLGWSTNPADSREQGITRRSSKALEEYGTARVPVINIIEAAINDTPVKVWDVDDKGNRTLNLDESEKANGKAQDIKDAFSDWIWADAPRAERLHRYYNDNFNNIRPIEYKGDHYKNEDGEFILPGMNPLVQLRPNQMKDVWQAVSNGKLLDASEVGAGKTFIMGAIAMEWRRLGMAKKPAIVVPKSRMDPTVAELQLLYPGAKILNFGKSFEGDKRQQATANAATGDYDIIVMSHEQLDFMPMRPEVVESFVREEIQEIEDRLDELRELDPEGYRDAMSGKRGGNRVVKQLEKAKERAEARLEEALDSSRRDKAVYFEESGIDAILVDEAHAFKSLPVYSRRAELKGVPTSRSNRATSMLMRARWLLSQNRGRGVVFATGTPVSNTLAELYNMQKYLQGDELKERGIQTFDAWADVFTNATTNYEYKATGEYQAVTRLTDFVNLPELRAMTQQVMATNFVDEMPWVTRPAKKEFVHSLPMSEDQQRYLQLIRARAEDLRSMSPAERKASGDNFLVLSTDARKSSLSTKLVDPQATEDDGKISSAINNILRIFHERPGKTQMIFCDMGVNKTDWGYSVYDEVIDGLVKGGVPREKIINFATATDKRRQEAADKLRKGEYLIAIGSTWKMGTGVNAQDLITAMHHLDIAWVPAYLEQRNGRGHRQGNTNSEVESHYYVTEGSFDLVMWQAVTRKLRGINSFMRGGVERTMRMDDTGDESSGELSPEMIMAAASGNPYELDRVKAQQDLERLERAERSHRSQVSQYKSRLANSSQVLEKYKEQIRDAEAGFAQYDATKGQDFNVSIDGKEYDNRKVAGEALAKYLQGRKHLLSEPVKIGNYRGFSVWADTVTDHITGEIRSRLMLSMPGMSYGVHTPGNERALNRASEYATQMKEYADDFASFTKMMPDASLSDIWVEIGKKRKSSGLMLGPPNFGAVFTSMDDALKSFGRMAEETADALKRTNLDIETAKNFISNPFKRAKELEDAKQKVKTLRDKISEFEESRKPQAKKQEEPTVVEISKRGMVRTADEGEYSLRTAKSRFSDKSNREGPLLSTRKPQPPAYRPVAATEPGMAVGAYVAKIVDFNESTTTPVHSVDITPEMKASVQQGQPMFAVNPWKTPKAAKPQSASDQAAIGGNIRAEFRQRGEGQGVVWINEQAGIAISAAMKRSGAAMSDGYRFEGVSMPFETANMLVDDLRERADWYAKLDLLKDEEREASVREFNNLADQIEEAISDAQANDATGVAIVDATAPNVSKVAREELFHNWQRKVGAMGAGDSLIRRMSKAAQDVYNQKIRPQLLKEGYTEFEEGDTLRQNSREWVLVTEAAAKMASGQAANYGVSDAEAADFISGYFETVARTFGIDALNNIGGLNYAAKQAAADVRQRQGGAISEGRSGSLRPRSEITGRGSREDAALASVGRRLSKGAPVAGQTSSESSSERSAPRSTGEPGAGKGGEGVRAAKVKKESPVPEGEGSRASRIGKGIVSVASAPRAFMASTDLSAPLRQGAILTLPPSQWGRASKAFIDMLKSLSHAEHEKFRMELHDDPDVILGQELGLFIASDKINEDNILTGHEEDFISRLAGKIPIVGSVIKASERTYTTYLDSLRASTFKSYKKGIEKMGGTPEQTEKALKAAADWINKSTGRGSLGKSFDNAATSLSAIFFAPRYVASRINVLNPAMYAKMPPGVRGRAIGEMFQYAAMVGATMLLAKAMGATVGADPDSPDFLKIKFGNWRYDGLAGTQQVMRLIWGIGHDLYNRSIGQETQRGRRMEDIVPRFLRSKLAPFPSAVVDWKLGEDYTGQPFSGQRAIVDRVTPLVIKDFVNAYQQEGAIGIAKASPAFFGVNVQNYTTGQKAKAEAKAKAPPSRKAGEPDDLYKARTGKIAEWKKIYTDKLESFPRYQALTDEEKQKAQDSLNRRILERSNRSRPDMKGLEPSKILIDMKKNAAIQARKARKMIYVPEQK